MTQTPRLLRSCKLAAPGARMDRARFLFDGQCCRFMRKCPGNSHEQANFDYQRGQSTHRHRGPVGPQNA